MPRHSKNANSKGFFTYDQTKKYKSNYGTIEQRIGADSSKPFEVCSICLQNVRDAMSCSKGHLFCKECILECLLAQKKEINKRKAMITKEKEKEILKEKEHQEEEKAKSISEFEKDQIGIPSTNEEEKKVDKRVNITSSLSTPAPLEEKSVEQLEKSLILEPKCPAGDHPINLKMLIPVNLNFVEDNGKCQCSSCLKEIKYQRVVLFKKCGHTLCYSCYDKLKPDKCFECNGKIKSKDVIELQTGGTSFAAHNSVVSKVYIPSLT